VGEDALDDRSLFNQRDETHPASAPVGDFRVMRRGVTLVAASAIFLGVAGLASPLPAARAAGTDPVSALRAS
jgi:hypothetical protein